MNVKGTAGIFAVTIFVQRLDVGSWQDLFIYEERIGPGGFFEQLPGRGSRLELGGEADSSSKRLEFPRDDRRVRIIVWIE